MSTALTRADVARIAELARLELTEQELELFTRQLGDILGYVEQIRDLDTTGVPPTSHGLTRPVERTDDEVTPLGKQAVLGNAPDAAPEAGSSRYRGSCDGRRR
ncbi:MAG: Asp-tRNA(Asn)/Glu-tRNA(Gln) amidotransferase subunit GatC [Vicinamibacterales bacterium]